MPTSPPSTATFTKHLASRAKAKESAVAKSALAAATAKMRQFLQLATTRWTPTIVINGVITYSPYEWPYKCKNWGLITGSCTTLHGWKRLSPQWEKDIPKKEVLTKEFLWFFLGNIGLFLCSFGFCNSFWTIFVGVVGFLFHLAAIILNRTDGTFISQLILNPEVVRW